jgi:hypothetical protein
MLSLLVICESMRQNIRDLDHVGPFVEKLKVATASRQTLLHGLVDDVTFVREHLSASAVTLMAQLEMYPTTIDGVGSRFSGGGDLTAVQRRSGQLKFSFLVTTRVRRGDHKNAIAA